MSPAAAAAALPRIVERFLERGSLHGLAFLSGREKLGTRIFWAVVMAAGVTTTALLFRASRDEWSDQPDITTIESMTRPVAELPFPAVSVCRSGSARPPDRFAAAAKLANFVKFRCGYRLSNTPCDESAAAMADFEFLRKFAFDLIVEKVEEIFEDGRQDSRFTPSMLSAMNKTASQVYPHLSSRSYEELKSLMYDGFWKGVLLKDFLANLDKSKISSSSDNVTTDFSEAQMVSAVGSFALLDPGPFGALLAELLPVYSPDHFSYDSGRVVRLKSDACGKIPDGVRSVHEFFADLTDAFKDEDEDLYPYRLSLLEVPSAVPRQPIKDMIRPKSGDTFAFSACGAFDNELPFDLAECAKAFEDMLYKNGSNPCFDTTLAPFCCDADGKLLGDDLKTPMKIMRQSSHRGRGSEVMENLQKIALRLRRNYTIFTSLGKGNTHRDAFTLPLGVDPYSAAPYCDYVRSMSVETSFGHAMPESCARLVPFPTDAGLCHTFNAPPVREIFRPSPFLSAFEEVFAEDLPSGDEEALLPAMPFGDDTGLTLFLDRQTLFRNDWVRLAEGDDDGARGGFDVTVSHQPDAFNARRDRFSARLGHRSVVLLTPTVLEARDDLRSVPATKRQCLFPDEAAQSPVPVTMFREYSHSRCQFECMLRLARPSCGDCTPWEYPFAANEAPRPCALYGAYCFEEVMKNTTLMDEKCGGCPADCNVVRYQIAGRAFPVDANKECQSRTMGFLNLLNKKTRRGSKFLQLFNSLARGSPFGGARTGNQNGADMLEDCRRMMREDVAVVTVKMASTVYTKLRRGVRMTFAQKVAAFGGTLGLFTGMSFLSMVEVGYWMMLMAAAVVWKKTNRRRRGGGLQIKERSI